MTTAIPIQTPRHPFAVRPARRTDAKPTVVDLFAGCGGLSLGLEQAGSGRLFVNELDGDAMATYLVNRLRDHPHLVEEPRVRYLRADLERRTSWTPLRPSCRRQAGHGGIDLVAGGPPCQGYSGIGHRRTFTDIRKIEIPSNHLYARWPSSSAPCSRRSFLFENVKGLCRSAGRRTASRASSGTTSAGRSRTSRLPRRLAPRAGQGVRRPAEPPAGPARRRPRRPRLPAGPTSGRAAFCPSRAATPPDPEDFLGDLVDGEYRDKAATTAYPREAETDAQQWLPARPAQRHGCPGGLTP